ncbi:aminodeoxychorismate lyase [Alginatibacterium sediminis]|uniref:Aminodeoxychorismate lyase n=1 Tax=Alginatibacterium sediminis TaxID=2164068 RepID=A0A420EHF7_9ALTE|nr:aminodeoxychorismate lyase [Alginatibacterium sediminis]RKF20129.1 aminodeoxychorismate lyase [Alginatibacterium sediminis]
MYKPAQIDSSDRAFNYGDGFFTTMLVKQGRIEHLELHQQRLLDCQTQLGFPPLSPKLWNEILFEAQNLVHSVLKVVISRGSGGRGYSPTHCAGAHWVISSHGVPAHQPLWRDKGVVADFATVALASGGSCSNLKTLNRIEQVQLKQQAEAKRVDELICQDVFGNVVEGVSANIFWMKNQKVYTPGLKWAGIHGVKRAWLLKVLAQAGVETIVGEFSQDEVQDADELWFTNSVFGIVPVAQLGSHFYSQFRFCRWLQTQ